MPDFLIESHLPISKSAKERISHEPLITGDSFRAIADHIIDETKIPFNPRRVRNGDIIFLGRNYLSFFFEKIYPKILSPFFLITSNGTGPTFEGYRRGASPSIYKNKLNDSKIIKWFSRNVDLPQHPKMHIIPVGACWFSPIREIKVLQEELNRVKKNFQMEKSIFCNVGFSVWTNPSKREPCYSYFKKQSFASIVPSLPFPEYINTLKNSLFVISPEGCNIDCYRTWEALICGAYPVVQSSTIDSLFEDLPVVIVNSWEEVTEEFLLLKKEEFERSYFNLEKLKFDYWKKIILNEKKKYLSKKN
ncbi:MAG: hypothetical protein Tsb0015_04160 [Simkaniaceae bacterium]